MTDHDAREREIRERWGEGDEYPALTGEAIYEAAADIHYLLERVERYREALEEIVEAHGIPGFADRHRAANRKMKEIAHRALNEGEDDGKSNG